VVRERGSLYNREMKNATNRIREDTAFFEANEYGGYTVTVPSLPGLVTEGKDLVRARFMAKDAIQWHVEGLNKAKEPIPLECETALVRVFVVG
jgi:antitoxin HicB